MVVLLKDYCSSTATNIFDRHRPSDNLLYRSVVWPQRRGRRVVNPGRGVWLADRTPLVSCPPVMPHTWTIVRREIYRSHKLNWPPEPLAAPHHPAGYPSILTGGQWCFTGPQLDTRSSPWFYERLTSHALIKHWPLLLGDSFFMITYIAYIVSKAN